MTRLPITVRPSRRACKSDSCRRTARRARTSFAPFATRVDGNSKVFDVFGVGRHQCVKVAGVVGVELALNDCGGSCLGDILWTLRLVASMQRSGIGDGVHRTTVTLDSASLHRGYGTTRGWPARPAGSWWNRHASARRTVNKTCTKKPLARGCIVPSPNRPTS